MLLERQPFERVDPAVVATIWVSTGIGRPDAVPATRPAVTRNGRTAGAGPTGVPSGPVKPCAPAGAWPSAIGDSSSLDPVATGHPADAAPTLFFSSSTS